MRYYLLTLGCPKNEVDSEAMDQILISAGHQPVADPQDADALIVNTCGFIETARKESLAQLKRLAAIKGRSGRPVCLTSQPPDAHGGNAAPLRQPWHDPTATQRLARPKLLIAAGCLPQNSMQQLVKAIPELDGILGTLRWGEINALLSDAAMGRQPCWLGESATEARVHRTIRRASAYLKIADGCDAACAFCSIPRIKGPQRSRDEERIVAEARQLAAGGAQEIVLIAQDTTAYGSDRGGRDGLAELLESLVTRVPEVPWFRIMYAHPAHISDRLIEVIAEHKQILKYLDIPLQHGHSAVLQRMRRPTNGHTVVGRLREAIPEMALRSAFIVGYPGETEEEFRGLLDFLDAMAFDRVGVFMYSPEVGTPAAELRPQVPQRVKRTRYARAMERQQQISLSHSRAQIGNTLQVLIEGATETRGEHGQAECGAVGRSYRDAPEVDGLVFVRQALPAGHIARVRIVEALPYDLIGEAIDVEMPLVAPVTLTHPKKS